MSSTTRNPAVDRRTAARRRGFTLLELIIVLIVLGLLAVIAIPAYASVTANAELRTSRTSNENIARIVGASLRLDNTNPAGTLAAEANPLLNGAAYTVIADSGAGSYSTGDTDMNYTVSGGYIGWAAHHRDDNAAMCRIATETGAYSCWIHTGAQDTHDGDTAVHGP